MVGDDIKTDDGKIAGYGLVVKKTVRAKLCLSNPTQEKNTFDEVSICWHKIILNYLVVRDKFLLRRQSLRLIADPQVLQQI